MGCLDCGCCCMQFLFFFKQKTAYEMRISDWSSDVCSSDLMCERWIVPRAGTALVAVPDTMRIYRTEVYLLSFVTAPFDANHREARGLSLEERQDRKSVV